MNMNEFQPILTTWQPFHAVSDIGHIKNEAHYARMVALADHLVEAGAANDGHELEDLFLLVCDLIGQYDDHHYQAAEVSAPDMLRFLMDQHGLTEPDLPELGNQAQVADVLNGKRDITVAQIRALANRFAISPATFF